MLRVVYVVICGCVNCYMGFELVCDIIIFYVFGKL